MTNNYLQFSQMLHGVPKEAVPWIEEVLKFDAAEADEKEFVTLRNHLMAWYDDVDLEFFPGFDAQLEKEENETYSLWLHSDESGDLNTLAAFVFALIRKFMPNEEFTLSAAMYCDKLRIDESGGYYLVVNKDGITQGSTWESIHEITEKSNKAVTPTSKYLLDVFSSQENYSACSYALVEITDELRTFIRSVQRDVVPNMKDRPFLVIEFFDYSPIYFEDLPEDLLEYDNTTELPNPLPQHVEFPKSDMSVGMSVIQIFDDEVSWRMIAKHDDVSHTTVPIHNRTIFDDDFDDRVLRSLGE
jgi:hypothetical protein